MAPWLRGYAPSSVPEDGAYGTGRLAADAAGLAEHLGATDPVLIGHDWGAIIGYGAVASEPQRWRKLVTMAVPPLGSLMAGFLTYAQIRRSWYMFVFQHPLAESIVAADDLHFIDEIWKEWSPGYDAGHDLPHVKDALRDEANLHAAIGYYRAMLGEPEGTDSPDPADAAAFLPSPVRDGERRERQGVGVGQRDVAVRRRVGLRSTVPVPRRRRGARPLDGRWPS